MNLGGTQLVLCCMGSGRYGRVSELGLGWLVVPE